jgi:hypothetical protein
MLATPGALAALFAAQQTAVELLDRHSRGDWGDICESDKELNEQSLEHGSRLMSTFTLTTGVKVWIITEAADGAGRRMATTILLPEEY